MGENSFVKEEDLDFSKFECCGDEDLYPFKCSNCAHVMVFCYECDTLYGDLNDLKNEKRTNYDINYFDPKKPSFTCPKCRHEFEYYFMKNPKYKVNKKEWTHAGFEDLLKKK